MTQTETLNAQGRLTDGASNDAQDAETRRKNLASEISRDRRFDDIVRVVKATHSQYQSDRIAGYLADYLKSLPDMPTNVEDFFALDTARVAEAISTTISQIDGYSV